MKLELDTIQFTDNNNIQSILDYATEIGISSLDTHVINEQCVGLYDLRNFDVSAKTIKIDYSLSHQENFEYFRDRFYLSQRKLGYIELYALLFSSAADLLSNWGLSLWDLVSDFKEKEYVYKLGVRVKSPSELIEIIDKIDIDIVHIPLNIIDQRFVGLLPELKRKKIEIHTYSTFLQGVLLMDYPPNYFSEIIPILNKIPYPKSAYALAFPKLLKEIDKIIIGCRTLKELQLISELYNTSTNNINFSQFRVDNEKFINPEIFNKECKYM